MLPVRVASRYPGLPAMDLDFPPPPLTIVTARCTVRVPAAMEPLPTPGVAVRGGLGKALRQTYCELLLESGHPAPHDGACSYCALFAPAMPAAGANALLKQGDAPRPYVIRPPAPQSTAYQGGELLPFELVLFGRAAIYRRREPPYG
jgi:hypothetical protein